jgi:hypothetical protein
MMQPAFMPGMYAADWGVAEDPQRGAGDRGARRAGGRMPYEAWK